MAQQPALSANRPNIIIITTDQQSADAMSCMLGPQLLHTPHMDQLAAQGVMFTNAYVANPICAPSRNSIITGQYPHITGIEGNKELAKTGNGNQKKTFWKGDEFTSMGTYFKQAGYETAYFGKWHLNYHPTDEATHGFQITSNTTENGKDSLMPLLVNEYLKRQHQKPFLLFLSLLNPHNICEYARFQKLPDGPIAPVPQDVKLLPPVKKNAAAPQQEAEALTLMRQSYHNNLKLFPVGNYTDQDWQRLAWGYYRLLEKTDTLVGKIMAAIKDNGFDENTLIIFTSDHGECLGAHQFNQKTVFYDESTKVPFIIRYKGKLKPGKNGSLINTGVDLLPTLFGFAGIQQPNHFPGKNLKETVANAKKLQRPYIVIQNKMEQGEAINGIVPEVIGRMVRTDRYKYCLYDTLSNREELFDLKNDPSETNNLAASAAMRVELLQHREYLKEFAIKNKDGYALKMLDDVQHAQNQKIRVNNNEEAYQALHALQPGDSLVFGSGYYKDIQLQLTNQGLEKKPIVLLAEKPGTVIICGDAKIALRGAFTELNGFYFTQGSRHPDQWKSHGPGLVAIYADGCRITNCAFKNFDESNSAYITTSLDEKGHVPVHCRIDHCSFTNKLTFDQVINLNNKLSPGKDHPIGGPPMYHRIDHCFFSNPKKKGNAGGAIRIGYYRNDTGRCMVDSNLFIRQDSEPEIITSKSTENLYYANTIINCQGTLNFRHGDKQVAINNIFLSNDEKFKGYGGMFIWGSQHIIAGNYFSLSKTLESRGNAAIYLNTGAEGTEHALAFGSIIAYNVFANNNGYAIHFNPLETQRKKFSEENHLPYHIPHHIQLVGNVFYDDRYPDYPFFKDDYKYQDRKNLWQQNVYWGKPSGLDSIKGLVGQPSATIPKNNLPIMANTALKPDVSVISDAYDAIIGIPFNFNQAMRNAGALQPLRVEEILPGWMIPLRGDYYASGQLNAELSERLNRIGSLKESIQLSQIQIP